MKKIFYGGTFNPPHLGHTRLAQAVLERGLGDEIIFCIASLALAAAARIFLRMFASSGDAPSAISSSPVMDELIFSSRNLFARSA